MAVRTMLTKLKLLQPDHSAATFETMWKLADTNQDGKISWEEFVRLFHRQTSEEEPGR